MRTGGLWRARMIGVVTAAAMAAVLAVPGPAVAAPADEARLLALSNALRASVGAPPLTVDETLTAVARAWATRIAANGTISHNPALSTQVTGWSRITENVGQGPDIETVHRALVASPPHHANLVDTQVTLVGIAVVTSANSVFVVENFMGRRGGAAARPAPAAAPAPATTVAKAPAAKAPTAPKPVAPRPAPTTVPTTVPVTVPFAGAPPADVPAAASPWMTLALEMTRTWERATG